MDEGYKVQVIFLPFTVRFDNALDERFGFLLLYKKNLYFQLMLSMIL